LAVKKLFIDSLLKNVYIGAVRGLTLPSMFLFMTSHSILATSAESLSGT